MKLTPLVLVILMSCASLKEVKKKHSEIYQRKEWPHWIDRDNDCQDTRQEILIERSKESVVLDRRGCYAKSGVWDDYYFPATLTRPKDIDIDHLIPLKHAHLSGGFSWTRQKKEIFANDPENLVITNKRYNRQKGSKGIEQWLPAHKSYACKYIKDWLWIKRKYNLILRKEEHRTISISGCSF